MRRKLMFFLKIWILKFVISSLMRLKQSHRRFGNGTEQAWFLFPADGLTYLDRRGTRRAAGLAGVWTHSHAAAAAAAAAGRTRKHRGRCCRREVCPEGEVCCPPSPQIERVWIPADNLWKLGLRSGVRPLECAKPGGKTKKRRCAKMKLRPSPCANFVPGGAATKSSPNVLLKGRNEPSSPGNV